MTKKNSTDDVICGENFFGFLNLDNGINSLIDAKLLLLDLDSEGYLKYEQIIKELSESKTRIWKNFTDREQDLYSNHIEKIYAYQYHYNCEVEDF